MFVNEMGDLVVHKNGNLKGKRKNKTVWTLTVLCKIIKSWHHQMLSKLSSLCIDSLRTLDEEANKFYDRKHDLYQTALLTDVTLNMLTNILIWK